MHYQWMSFSEIFLYVSAAVIQSNESNNYSQDITSSRYISVWIFYHIFTSLYIHNLNECEQDLLTNLPMCICTFQYMCLTCWPSHERVFSLSWNSRRAYLPQSIYIGVYKIIHLSKLRILVQPKHPPACRSSKPHHQ